MGGLATLTALQTAYGLEDRVPVMKTALVNPAEPAGTWLSLWICGVMPEAAATPGAAATCSKTTTGSLVNRYVTTGKRAYLSTFSCFNFGIANTQNETSTIILYDRLIQSGGLSGIVFAVPQLVLTPTLPTRLNNANGADVEAFVEVFADLGATSAQITVAYTDSANASQTSVVTYTRRQGRMVPIPTAAGAAPGFKSIESVTLDVSTGTAGNFGVTLAHRIGVFPAATTRGPQVRFDANDAAFAPVHADACVWMTVINGGEDATGTYGGMLGVVEEP